MAKITEFSSTELDKLSPMLREIIHISFVKEVECLIDNELREAEQRFNDVSRALRVKLLAETFDFLRTKVSAFEGHTRIELAIVDKSLAPAKQSEGGG